ncbi:MAG: hypothetical protein WCC60_01215 [Ilumatobacteraceae bacterium]
MTEQRVRPWDENPTIEVRVYRHGELVHSELCESEELAALLVERWGDVDDVRCEVIDVTATPQPGDIFQPESEPEAIVGGDEDYPHDG